MRVQRVAHDVGGELLDEIEMRDLSACVHAGIGTSRTGERHALLRELEYGILQRGLNGRSVLLTLPAGKRPAVIFDHELVARHQESLSPALSVKPRRNASASIGARPARCTVMSFSARSEQATTSDAST